MNTDNAILSSTSVTDEAWSWVARLDELTAGDRAELEDWLRQSNEHVAEFEAAQRDWDSLEFLQLLQGDSARPGDRRAAGQRGQRRHAWRIGLPLAAAAALALAAVTIWWTIPREFQSDYVTVVGEQQEFRLPDDSTMLLNTNTSLSVHFTGAQRTVLIDYGEAHFQVAHELDRPFVVLAGASIVRAVGTAFSVNVSRDKVEVTVTDGEVELARRPELPSAAAALPEPVDSGTAAEEPVQRLAAGYNARITDSIEPATPVDPDILERKLAWRHGMLEFVNAPLGEVVAEVGRYTTNALIITDPELETHRVTITARASDIGGLLRILDASNTEIVVMREPDNNLVLISRP